MTATEQDTTVQLSAHERRVRGLSNWVRDFPVGPGPLKEWEQAQLFALLPYTDEAVALRLFDELGDQLLIMGGHDQHDQVYREASARFDSLVEDAISEDEKASAHRVSLLQQQLDRRDAVLNRIADANTWLAIQDILAEHVTAEGLAARR
jgi:hypothetical protein